MALFIMNYAFADFFASVVLNRPDLTFYIRIASIAVVFQVISTTTTSAFIGLDKTEYDALTSSIQAISKTIVSIALVLLGFSVVGALLGFVASYIVAAVAGTSILFFILSKIQKRENNPDFKDDLKTLVRYGAPLYVSLLLTGSIPLYQNVMLAIFTADAEIGNFRAAMNFTTLITVLTIPITTALLPAFSKFDVSTTQKVRTFFKLANKYTTIMVLPITFLIIIFSNDIVNIIYGATYSSASLFLAAYSLLYLLVGVGSLILPSLYNGLGETRITLYISLITFLTFAALSPILTKIYNVQGLIIAFLIASTAGTSYGAYTARKKFKIEFETRLMTKIYFISILSSIPPLALVHFSPLPNVLNITAGGLLYLFTYFTLTPATRIVRYSELQTATQILQRIKPLTLITTPLLKYQKKILGQNKQPQKL